MRKVTLLLVLTFILTCGSNLLAQKEGAVWYFGAQAGLDFNDYYPKPVTKGQLDTKEGVATICDKEGNMLFYTDGTIVYNRNHQVMVNGEGLFGDISSTQSSIIVPSPGKPLEYYIFTVDKVGTTADPGKGLNYSIVDLLQNSPMGRVTQKNIQLVPGTNLVFTEKITAVKHSDGESYWIVTHAFNSRAFYVFKLDRAGLHAPDVYEQGAAHVNTETPDNYNRGATGYLKSSPKGDYLAVAVESLKIFELFSFNSGTGQVRYMATLPAGSRDNLYSPQSAAYGVEFSPTGNYFYGSTRKGGFIFQWSLANIQDVNAIINSVRIIRENKSIICGALQLGFNGKIYVALSGQPYLGVINSPIQENCKYLENGASLVDTETGIGGKGYFGLPTFLPDFFKAAEFYFENTCQNDTTLFYLSTRFNIESQPAWFIYNKQTGDLIDRAIVNPETYVGSYKFTTPGDYIVELRVRQFGSDISRPREITIHPLPELNFRPITPLCKGNSVELDAGYGAFYGWKDNPNLTTERYRTIRFPGTFMVTVRHYNGCINSDTTEVVEQPLPKITDQLIGKAACGLNSGSIKLIMETDPANYIFTWTDDPSNHSYERTGLAGGVYEVTIKSVDTSCKTVAAITVSEENSPDVQVQADPPGPVCPGTKVTLTASGTANYLWMNPADLTDRTIEIAPMTTGTYIVKGYSTDVNGQECKAFAQVQVEVFPYNPPQLGADRFGCKGETIELDGTSNYMSWNWSTGETSQKINILETRLGLILEVMDQNQCTFTDEINVTINDLPIVDLGEDRIVCKGTEVKLDGGEAEKWLWNTSETTRIIDVTSTDHYEVLVTNKNGCFASDDVYIRINSRDALGIAKMKVSDINCNGAANGSIEIQATGDGSFYEYSLDNGEHYFDNLGLFENLDGKKPYRIAIREDGVCEYHDTQDIVLKEPDAIQIDYRLVSPSCEQCEDGEISLIITGGTPPYSVLWSTMDSVKRLRNIGLGTYPVWIRDSLKCNAYKNIDMVKGEASYSIPNAFTPNGDGVNETWVITALKDKPDCIVQVFTRDGRKVIGWEKGYKVPWDGRDLDGNMVPVGSYFYLIRVDGTVKPLTGSVTVLK